MRQCLLPGHGHRIAIGMAHEIGSLEAGKPADIVLWRPDHFGAKPELVRTNTSNRPADHDATEGPLVSVPPRPSRRAAHRETPRDVLPDTRRLTDPARRRSGHGVTGCATGRGTTFGGAGGGFVGEGVAGGWFGDGWLFVTVGWDGGRCGATGGCPPGAGVAGAWPDGAPPGGFVCGGPLGPCGADGVAGGELGGAVWGGACPAAGAACAWVSGGSGRFCATRGATGEWCRPPAAGSRRSAQLSANRSCHCRPSAFAGRASREARPGATT